MPQKVFKIFNYFILALLGISTLYPFYYFFILSFNDGLDAQRGGIYLWPRIFTFNNYLLAFKNPNIMNAYTITLFRTIAGMVISLTLTSMLAYGLTKKDLPFRRGIIFYFFFTTMFSGGMIPFYILLRQLGLTKSIWIYILPYLYVFFYTVIVRTFFETIPAELSEAAIIDGCNDIQIYLRVYLPLSVPVMATMALFFGVMHWNDWQTGSFYVANKKMIPAATLLQSLMTEATFEESGGAGQQQLIGRLSTANTTPEALRMTVLVITTLPIICVYPFIQKYFTKGVMVGSVKG
jgi:putative aldouronate transport system permease protein